MKDKRRKGKKIIKEGKDILFVLCSVSTMVYILLILLEFILGEEKISIPPEFVKFYLFLLGAYIGIKEVSNRRKIKDGKKVIRKKGERFFFCWIIFYLFLMFLASFKIGNVKVIKEVWPLQLSILILFLGTEFAKSIPVNLLRKIKK